MNVHSQIDVFEHLLNGFVGDLIDASCESPREKIVFYCAWKAERFWGHDRNLSSQVCERDCGDVDIANFDGPLMVEKSKNAQQN